MADQSRVLYRKKGKQSGHGRGDEDEWDDSVLIEAYDRAMARVKELTKKRGTFQQNGKEQAKSRKKSKWKAGDYCQALYSEDGLLYEAEILEVDESNGVCVVQFLGYGNEEEVSLKDLRASEGKAARDKQIRAAQNQDLMQWEVGDRCRALYSEDGLMYEAVILEIYGYDETCLVKFVGYDNEEEVCLRELEPSLGKKPKNESDAGGTSQQDGSVTDELSSTYSSEPSSLTASEDNRRASKAHHHPTASKSESQFANAGTSYCSHRSSCRPPPQSSSMFEPCFLPSEHFPVPVNGELAGVSDDLGSMLIAWYMAGYHTGYYQGRQSRSASEGHRHRFHHHH